MKRSMSYLQDARQSHAQIASSERFSFFLLLTMQFVLYSEIIELLIKANHLEMLATGFRKEFEPYIERLGIDGEYIGYGLTIRIAVAISILP